MVFGLASRVSTYLGSHIFLNWVLGLNIEWYVARVCLDPLIRRYVWFGLGRVRPNHMRSLL